jgi:hypothetical protein
MSLHVYVWTDFLSGEDRFEHLHIDAEARIYRAEELRREREVSSGPPRER